MPYIAIKGYPKDEETKRKIAERINEAFLELWGCPQEAINLSFEDVAPENWEEQVTKAEIEPNADKMVILNGKKRYEERKLTIFHLNTCPYCQKARDAMEELKAENPAYGAVSVEWIEENEHPEIADQYDYYSVPTFYLGKEKLYEAHLGSGYEEIRENLRRALDAV